MGKPTYKILISILILGLSMPSLGGGDVAPAHARALSAISGDSSSLARASVEAKKCRSGTEWVWTSGPSQPATALKAQAALHAKGISASVAAYGFGEKDSCGAFELFAVDYEITLKGAVPRTAAARKTLGKNIRSTLAKTTKPQLGNVRVKDGSGETVDFSQPPNPATLDTATASLSAAEAASNKKVYLLIYDPILSNGQKLHEKMGWGSSTVLTQQVMNSFLSASRGQLGYSLAYTTEITDEWPLHTDGYRYTEAEYLYAYSHRAPHLPDSADYDAIIADPRFDICGKLNAGEIDELWIYAMPYAGLYESRLVGPNAYGYNSPPVDLTHGCSKLLPIMGLNYERGLPEAMHSFGHRMEASMTYIYGGWEENRTKTGWDRFGLVKAQSPDYSYSGCGSVHFPPNGTAHYDYSNPGSTLTNCDDFSNYPNLSDPLQVAVPVTCTTWNCSQYEFLMYWYGHLPQNLGCAADRVANDWWPYFADPNLALYPTLNCPEPTCPTITEWKGEYWSNPWLIGPAALCRNDATVDFQWGDASPDPTLKADKFSARWTRTSSFDAGVYRFYVSHDDGARIYIDDAAMAGGDFWDTACRTDSVDTRLEAGNHTIRIEMFEWDGGASAKGWWAERLGYIISGNAGVNGATITYTGGSTVSDRNGDYTFTVPSGWSGTVTPTKAGYLFSPPSSTYGEVVADQSDQDYTAGPVKYTISGNAGVAVVTINYTGGTTTSGSTGDYSFKVPEGWSGTVTPSKSGYTFLPASRSYENVTSDRPDQDYGATVIMYSISGNAGLAEATISYTGGSTTTASDGTYSFAVQHGWSGTVTPSKAGYLFSPGSRSYQNVTGDRNGQDYSASPVAYTISGNAGVGQATINYNGAIATSGIDGSYSFMVPHNWTGTATPSKPGYSFSPPSTIYSEPVTGDLPAQNYTATLLTYTISGNAGVAEATIDYVDGAATTDSSGAYSFSVPYGWSRTVTPSKTGYTFSPASRPYPNVTSNWIDQNYAAIAIRPRISGNAGVGGATVDYGEGSTTADSGGTYVFRVPYGWSGTVTPSKPGYTFSPGNRSYEAEPVTADRAEQNFTATLLRYTISGNAGVAWATISYTGGATTAGSAGSYSFSVPYGWSGIVTPSKPGYTFLPVSKLYGYMTTNWTGHNYAATLLSYTISGNAGAPGAAISYPGGSVIAGTDGRYAFSVPYGWTGTVTPSKTDLTFVPASRSYSNVKVNQTAGNYSVVQQFPSGGAADGWIAESSELSNVGGTLSSTSRLFTLGDDATRSQYRAILSFHTSGLPDNAIIESVKLRLVRRAVMPRGTNPFDLLGGLMIDVRNGFFGPSLLLQAVDFQAAPTRITVGPFKPTPVGARYTITLPTTAYAYINKMIRSGGVTQLRLRFRLGDNNNDVANLISFYSGNARAAYRPVLIITYHLP